MNYTQILIGLFSGALGGVVVSFVQNYLDKNKQLNLNLNKLTEDKYKNLLIFMACVLDINKKRYFHLNESVPNNTSQDYLNQIKEYYYHGLLYSNDEVIISLKNFIENPTKETYIKTAISMRKDLWNKNTKLKKEDILLD